MEKDWPKEVIATSSKGKKEARVLKERGQYALYTYVDPATKKLVRKGKESIWLKNEKGELVQLFMIPLKDKYLTIKTKGKRELQVWDPKKKKASKLF